MKVFHYTAYDNSGKKQSGKLRADCEKAARDQLREKDLLPESLHEHRLIREKIKWKRQKRLSKLELSILTRELAELLQGGIPLVEALEILSKQVDKAEIKQLVLDIRDKLQEGYSFSSILKQYGDCFPNLYVATIESGERAGQLNKVMLYLADYAEKQYDIQQKIQQALVYPSLMTLVSIGIIAFLLMFVFPKFVSIFEDVDQSLPTITNVLLSVTQFLSHYYFVCILGIISLVILWKLAKKRIVFTHFIDQFILKIPFVKNCLITYYSSHFTRVLAVLLNSGVDIVEAIQISSHLIQNTVVKQRIYESALQVQEGNSIADSLSKTQCFRSLTIHFIDNGEHSGYLTDMLERVSDIHNRHLNRLISISLTLFEPLLILVMGVLVLLIVLAMLLPMLDITQLIV